MRLFVQAEKPSLDFFAEEYSKSKLSAKFVTIRENRYAFLIWLVNDSKQFMHFTLLCIFKCLGSAHVFSDTA